MAPESVQIPPPSQGDWLSGRDGGAAIITPQTCHGEDPGQVGRIDTFIPLRPGCCPLSPGSASLVQPEPGRPRIVVVGLRCRSAPIEAIWRREAPRSDPFDVSDGSGMRQD